MQQRGTPVTKHLSFQGYSGYSELFGGGAAEEIIGCLGAIAAQAFTAIDSDVIALVDLAIDQLLDRARIGLACGDLDVVATLAPACIKIDNFLIKHHAARLRSI